MRRLVTVIATIACACAFATTNRIERQDVDIDVELYTADGVDAKVADVERNMTNSVSSIATSLIGAPYVLQGAKTIPTNAYSVAFSGQAEAEGDIYYLCPKDPDRKSKEDSLGTLIITVDTDYLVDIDADLVMCPYAYLQPLNDPITWTSARLSDTQWQVSAWHTEGTGVHSPLNGGDYYAYVSNLVVYTYDRPGHTPNTLTNDTAAIVSRVDTVETDSADERQIVNLETLKNYIDEQFDAIAKSAWNWTPSGKVQPSSGTTTLDKPLVQQGNIAFLQSGDYFVMSYEGGDWFSEQEGSTWSIGASGNKDFVITSTNKMANIRDFVKQDEVAIIYANTNWMSSSSEPFVEFCETLSTPQWLACQSCTSEYVVDAENGDYWKFIAPATADSMFYRVQIPGGENRIIANKPLMLNEGIEVDGHMFNSVEIEVDGVTYEVLGRVVE